MLCYYYNTLTMVASLYAAEPGVGPISPNAGSPVGGDDGQAGGRELEGGGEAGHKHQVEHVHVKNALGQ